MDRLLTIGESADRLGVSLRTVKRWISDGDLKPLDLNGGKKQRRILRISESDLEAFARRGEQKPRESRRLTRPLPQPKKQHV